MYDISKYMLPGFESKEVFDKLVQDPVFPLVREMVHAFKLRVLDRVIETEHQPDKYILCDLNGFALGAAWAKQATITNQLEYRFHTPFALKERGKSRIDKETYYSVKVSSLVKAIKQRIQDIRSSADLEMKAALWRAKHTVSAALGDDCKLSGMNVDEIHTLLAAYLNKQTEVTIPRAIDFDKCQKELDKLERVDILVVHKRKEEERLFGNPFHAVFVDTFGYIVAGKLRQTDMRDDKSLTVIEPFKRYRSEADVAEIAPLMTMIKVFYEVEDNLRRANARARLWGDKIPVCDHYEESLDVVFGYRVVEASSVYKGCWLFTPCDTQETGQ